MASAPRLSLDTAEIKDAFDEAVSRLKDVAKTDLPTGPALEPIKVSQFGREFRHCLLDEQFQSKDDKHAALDSQVSYPPTR